jgi:hypothetical protein
MRRKRTGRDVSLDLAVLSDSELTAIRVALILKGKSPV